MHITLNRETDLSSLTESSNNTPSLSIYLPVHPRLRSETINEDAIRFKNSLRTAKEKLNKNNDPKTKKVLDELKHIEGMFSDKGFWENQSRGLALFINNKGHHLVHLPYEVSEHVFIESEFVVSPLLAMKQMDYRFYMLDVNTKSPSLYMYDKGNLNEVEDAKLPGTMSDALQLDELNKSQQFHTGEGGRRAVYHGHGGNTEAKQDEVESYLRLLAHKVDLYMKKIVASSNSDTAPLILLGSEDRVSYIKDALKYSAVTEHTLATEGESPMQHQQLLKAVEDFAGRSIDLMQQKLANEWQEKYANEMSVTGVQEIKTACKMNNVDKVLVPILALTNDSVTEGAQRQYKFVLSDSISAWEQAARKSIDCGATVYAIDPKEHSLPEDILGLCRFKVEIK